jgi:Uma2 family endonuclease
MTALAADRKIMTPEEYLAWERTSEQKHEFFQGEVFAMAGTTFEHNLIVGNLVRLLGNALKDSPCRVCPSDLRVKIPATGLYTYPDVTVVCQHPEFEDDHRDTLLNPQVIIEVLSDTTEAYDRGKKFQHYRSIPSLKNYILIPQKEILIEHYTPYQDGFWLWRDILPGRQLKIESIGCEIPVDEIYLKVFD